jgi:hypothetical protein
VRPERQESLRRDAKHWIHSDRRKLVSAPDQRPAESRQRPDEQPLDVDEAFSTQVDPPSFKSDPTDIPEVQSQTSSERGYEPPSAEEVRRAAIESVQEKDETESGVDPLLKQPLAQARREPEAVEKAVKDISSKQMLESRIAPVSSPNTSGQSPAVGPVKLRQPKAGSGRNEVNGVGSFLSKRAEVITPLVMEPQSQRTSRWDQKPRNTAQEQALRRDQLGIKARNQQNKPKNPMKQHTQVTSHLPDNQLSRGNSRPSQESMSLPISSLGEKELNQNTKHATGLPFEQTAGTTVRQTVTIASTQSPDLLITQSAAVTRPECLSVFATDLTIAVGNAIISAIIETPQENSADSVVKSMHSPSVQVSPNPLAANMHLRTPGSSYDFTPSRLATVDEVTAVTSNTLSVIGDKVPPRADALLSLKQDGILSPKLCLSTDSSRNRGTSIASSRSSGSFNSRQSASPFLSALFTPGNCLVCSEKDRPCNRLARCSACASLYHQSCHSPSLTKAVLEEAAENWICHACKAKGEKAAIEETASVSSTDVSVRRSSGLSVTLKTTEPEKIVEPEKALEEQVMVNKSSFSNLLQRHAQWKSPTGHSLSQFSPRESDNERRQSSVASTPKIRNLPSHGLGIVGAPGIRNVTMQESALANPVPRPNGVNKVSNSNEQKAVGLTNGQKPVSKISETSRLTKIQDATSRFTESSLDLIDDLRISLGEDTLEQISPAEAVPSIKHPKQAIPASQSDSSQISSNLTIIEPESPVTHVRRRNHRKRDLVISDSEEESSAKKMKFIPPRAAMKSAPSTRLVMDKPAPIKLPVMSGTLSTTIDNLKKSSVVAKKSGTKFRESEIPLSDKGDHNPKVKEMDREGGNLRSPISPVMHEIRRLPRQVSPLLARPTDRAESQRYSLQWVLSKGSEKNQPVVVDNEDRGFDYSTPYPAPQKYVQRHIPSSPKRKRSRDKKNFDVLSLVPPMAVPVLEDGKLAFREGAIDARTGHLKRGARKFKVGRISSGEIV